MHYLCLNSSNQAIFFWCNEKTAYRVFPRFSLSKYDIDIVFVYVYVRDMMHEKAWSGARKKKPERTREQKLCGCGGFVTAWSLRHKHVCRERHEMTTKSDRDNCQRCCQW
jgi:hypothetical protein